MRRILILSLLTCVIGAQPGFADEPSVTALERGKALAFDRNKGNCLACTRELWPIFILTDIDGIELGPNSNDAASGVGLLSTTMLIDSTLSRPVLIVTGTTAPFSAMSGIFILI